MIKAKNKPEIAKQKGKGIFKIFSKRGPPANAAASKNNTVSILLVLSELELFFIVFIFLYNLTIFYIIAYIDYKVNYTTLPKRLRNVRLKRPFMGEIIQISKGRLKLSPRTDC